MEYVGIGNVEDKLIEYTFSRGWRGDAGKRGGEVDFLFYLIVEVFSYSPLNQVIAKAPLGVSIRAAVIQQDVSHLLISTLMVDCMAFTHGINLGYGSGRTFCGWPGWMGGVCRRSRRGEGWGTELFHSCVELKSVWIEFNRVKVWVVRPIKTVFAMGEFRLCGPKVGAFAAVQRAKI